MRIALVEDDQAQAELTALWLGTDGHSCEIFTAAQPFLRSLARDSFDLLLLDWVLPGMSGLELLQTLRRPLLNPVPVLFLTQQDTEQDMVRALDAGADDYLTKPVSRQALLARVRALGRRAQGATTRLLEVSPYRFDLDTHGVTRHGVPLELTPLEFELAFCLFRNAGRLLTRAYLLETVWGRSGTVQTRTVDMHISQVRAKLGLRPENGWRIVPVYSTGYRLEACPAP